MSYSAEISFKKINGKDICIFFQQLKRKVIDNIDKIAEDSFIYSPFARKLSVSEISDMLQSNNSKIDSKFYYEVVDKYPNIQSDVDLWIEKLFKYRWFYLVDIEILGVYGVPDSVKDLFDTTIFFQNSCDQDYEFDEWNGVPEFEEIARKWRNKTDEEMLAVDPEYSENDYPDLDYYRRSLCYNEIWELIEDTLYDDESVTYVQMFGSYDIIPYQFRILVLNKCIEWLKDEGLVDKMIHRIED